MQTGRAGALVIAENVYIPKFKANRTHVYNDRYNYTIAVTVRNIGSIEVTTIDVYLNGTLITHNTTATCWTSVWNYTIGRPPGYQYGWSTTRRDEPDTQWWMPETVISPGSSATIYIVDAWLRKGYPCVIRVVTGQGAYSDISFYPP